MSRVFNRYGFGATNFIFGASALLLLLLIMPHAHAADINVPAGGNLQQAIDNAQPGDTINLAAGATFVGTVVLRQKVGDAWITIQSSALAQLPGAGVRVTPSHAAMMPKIVSGGLNAPALRTESGAHHYRLIGIEIRTTDELAYVDDLVLLGNNTEQTTLESVPHHLVMDRCLITAYPNQRLKRGIALNSAHTDIINCHIAGFKVVGQDAQAIGGVNGPGPFDIINNYLEGAGENLIFGGDDPQIPGLVPSDIVIKRNHFFKPLSWRASDPSYAGIHWTVKNLLELKNARRVQIEGNVLENSWIESQGGTAILFHPWNQSAVHRGAKSAMSSFDTTSFVTPEMELA